jgi:chromosome segregation protein
LRLTHLKLAGFKSFVDPTTLHLHGQRVGIVGPNGCGKSNVMEAIRWVLGESSARELRGDSMQDVIFNGTINRKQVSRASVELHFDNSFGGAQGVGGQWSQYAEIAVKRVLERDGNSSYLINNTQVRRRDVTDLFLGTGVGSRAYAIIGQNTISRIVEAKPEEIRIFLEEAAGVSKYKERRRETELRLRDTRENLTRVDDIRRELDKQITHLEAQAEVARRYHQLKQQLDTAQQLLWLLKMRQAAGEWEKARKRAESLVNGLEAEMAGLRRAESELEQTRLQHAEAGGKLQQAQAAFYEASSVMSGIEQQFKHAQENLERAATRERDLAAQLTRVNAQMTERGEALAEQERMSKEAEKQGAAALDALETSRAALPEYEVQHRAAQHSLNSAHAALAKAEQAYQVTLSDLQHQRRQLDQQHQRRQRLETEKNAIVLPSQDLLHEKESLQQHAQQQLSGLDAEIAASQEREIALQAELHQMQQSVHEESRRVAQLEAQLGTLHKIQQTIGSDARLAEWLAGNHFSRQPRFWQSLRVQPGWETALESALGERLNALVLDTLEQAGSLSTPPLAVVLCAPTEQTVAAPIGHRLMPLTQKVEALSSALASVVGDWLAGVYAAESYADALQTRMQLSDGEWLACPEGHLVSRTSVRMYAPGSALHGVLERQREVDALERQLPMARAALESHELALKAQQEALAEMRHRLGERRHAHKQLSNQLHTVTLEVQHLKQQRQHAEERLRQFAQELEELSRQITAGEELLHSGEADRAEQESALFQLKQQRDECRRVLGNAENALTQARDALRRNEHNAQETEFNIKTIANKINELKNTVNVLVDQNNDLVRQMQEVHTQRNSHDTASMKAALADAIELRRQREESVAELRNQLAGIETSLSETERRRLQSEQGLHPMRDRLEQARLAEQEARLHFEHCRQQLAGADEAALAAQLEKTLRPADMTSKTAELQQEIDALGAVNLAAIEQLASERERASYLENQAQDLNSAIATLEEAIHRIDRETRGRLQHTFDEVNRNFAELFSVLFNGGQARLELLGDEILDTGILVFAQPPGKKNSTIHLLSGGEKALSALALVFALFRLNPAPFCLMDEVDAPLDDSNTERFCALVKKMSEHTQFVFISHNKIAMEMAQQLIGVTMQESGVSRVVEVDVEEAMRMTEIA